MSAAAKIYCPACEGSGVEVYHWQCDATHDEARRRQKPWLYQRGWNDAYRSAGHEPSESDIEAAKAPADRAIKNMEK